MPIRNMTRADLDLAIEWAANEGWNPGLEDASAFFAADPRGFFANEVDGEIAAIVSVVNHSDTFAFLGFYICAPEFRGQGKGIEVWNTAMTYASDRCVGLDGVPDQQDNYRKSGFSLTGQTERYQGKLPSGNAATNPRSASPFDLNALLALDQKISGVTRPAFAEKWYTDTNTRKTFTVTTSKGAISGLATARQCHEGIKVGPLWAQDTDVVGQLLAEVSSQFSAEQVQIDVPTGSEPLAHYLAGLGFVTTFETARMYTGAIPVADPGEFYAIATMELG